MARGINKAILIGNLGRDPEVRYTQDQRAVTNFSVATSERWTDRNTNELQERTEWHRIVCFGRLAEIAGQYLRKGSKVYIEGRMQTRSYEREGQTHYTTEVVANDMQMLDSRGGDMGQDADYGPGPEQRPAPAQGRPAAGVGGGQQQAPAQAQDDIDDFEDDIPF